MGLGWSSEVQAAAAPKARKASTERSRALRTVMWKREAGEVILVRSFWLRSVQSSFFLRAGDDDGEEDTDEGKRMSWRRGILRTTSSSSYGREQGRRRQGKAGQGKPRRRRCGPEARSEWYNKMKEW